MITFGLTGGIACGKSTVTKTMRAEGCAIVDADIVARQVVEPGTPGLKAVIETFGPEYLQEDGTLNRTKLGGLVFFDKVAMDKINKLMYPLINNEAVAQIKKLHDEGQRVVGYDAALICEQGNVELYRPLVVVECREDTQIARLMSRNTLTRAEAVARIESQMPVQQKVAMADFVINTDGTLEESIKQTKSVVHRIYLKMYQMLLDSGKITYSQVPYPWRDTAGNDACWDCDCRPCVCEPTK
jgi:dephospho-CoA kinase